MSGKGHVPIRRCVACGVRRPRNDLIRLMRAEERLVVVDARKRLGGRGAYVCPTAACVNRVLRRGIPERALGPGGGRALTAEAALILKALAQGEDDGQAHL